MYTGAKETLCTNCDHREVCSLTKEFLAAQQAVDNLTVSLGDRTMKDLRDFSWIKAVSLECVHFTEKRPKMRAASEAACAARGA